MSDQYEHEFKWATEAGHVFATGTFDEWRSTLQLEKEDGKLPFSAKVPLPWGSKVLFKYVVDGTWQHNPDEPCETDSSGNVNNVLNIPTKPEEATKPQSVAAAAASTPFVAAAVPTQASAPTSTLVNPEATPAAQAIAAHENPTVPHEAIVSEPIAPVNLPYSPSTAVPATSSPAVATPAGGQKSDVPALAAATAGLGAVAAGLAVVGGKAYEAAASALGHGSHKAEEGLPTPVTAGSATSGQPSAVDSAKEAGNKAYQEGEAFASKAKLEAEQYASQATAAISSTSFGASTLKALGIEPKHVAAADTTSGLAADTSHIPPPNEAITTLPASEAPLSSAPAVPEKAIVTPTAASGTAVKSETGADKLESSATAATVTGTGNAVPVPAPASVSSPPAPVPVAPLPATPSAPAPTPAPAATVTSSPVPATPVQNQLGSLKKNSKSNSPSGTAGAGKPRKPSFFNKLKEAFASPKKEPKA